MICVYVAGPITVPSPKENAIRAIEYGDMLIDLGFCPFLPQLSIFQEEYGEKRDDGNYGAGYEVWMKLDFEWIKRCDVLLRLPGFSKGADREVAYAQSLGKLVFFTVEDLTDHFSNDPAFD